VTNSANNQGLKTPLISDKMAKKQNFAMTPDIHTKTYAERQTTIGVQSSQIHPKGSAAVHASAKTNKNT
jgi:hypothetical protein